MSQHRAHLASLLLVCFANACHSQSPSRATPSGVTITPLYENHNWGEIVRVRLGTYYNPGDPYVQYLPGDCVRVFVVTCNSKAGLTRQILPHPGETAACSPVVAQPLPLRRDTAIVETTPLEIGHWTCSGKGEIKLIDRSGRVSPATYHSNTFTIEVDQPSKPDEEVIRDSGLWDVYKQGGIPTWTQTTRPIFGISPAINNHPDSHYYCRYWVEELHKAFDFSKSQRALETKPDDPANEGGFVAWGAKPSKFTVPLDNLDKYKCSEATPADYAFWRAENALSNLSDFAAAQAFARKGLALNPDPNQKAYFEKLLRFHSEADYLRQFKHVKRLGADGQWHE